MKKLLVLFSLLFVFFFPQPVLASSARSVVETQVESSGETQVYQSVETTVNGQTVRKESKEPGKLELEMEKAGEGEPTVRFSQEAGSLETQKLPVSFFSQVVEFFQKLFFHLTSWFK